MDPKNDEWAPHLFKKACLDAGKPFILIDLNKQQCQLDFLDGITGDHLEELLVAGFGLSEKGEAADFYRIDDRRAARYTGQLIEMFPDGATIKDLFNSDYVSGIAETIKGFHGKLEELSLLKSINAKGGLRLQDISPLWRATYLPEPLSTGCPFSTFFPMKHARPVCKDSWTVDVSFLHSFAGLAFALRKFRF